jgi:hypothetical protein
MMRNYSYEVYDSKFTRIAVEDYFQTIKEAKFFMIKIMKTLENDSKAVLYRRYADGDWGNYQEFAKKYEEITRIN